MDVRGLTVHVGATSQVEDAIIGPFRCNYSNDTNRVSLRLEFDPSQNITNYSVVGVGIECQTPCRVNSLCPCTISKQQVNVTVSARNSDGQMVGPAVRLVVATCKSDDELTMTVH